MENNNTPRKADLHYDGWEIPIVVLEESTNMYTTKLDPSRLPEYLPTDALTDMRNAYVDVCCDSVGWGKRVPDFDAASNTLALVKEEDKYALVFDEPELEPDEAQDDAVDTTGIDDVPPPNDSNDELNQHLTLLAHSGYKVKSFDLSIQEGGEAHLCATFTK